MVAAIALATWLAGCGGAEVSRPLPSKIAPETKSLVATAEAHERHRRYDLAKVAYQRAVDEAPNAHSGAFASRKMASALLFWGEYAEAEKALATTVKLRPEDVSAWHDLGIVRDHLGNPVGAEQAFRKSIELRPKIPLSRLALAAMLVNQRRFDEALAQYDALLELELPERYQSAIRKAQRMIRAEMRAAQ